MAEGKVLAVIKNEEGEEQLSLTEVFARKEKRYYLELSVWPTCDNAAQTWLSLEQAKHLITFVQDWLDE